MHDICWSIYQVSDRLCRAWSSACHSPLHVYGGKDSTRYTGKQRHVCFTMTPLGESLPGQSICQRGLLQQHGSQQLQSRAGHGWTPQAGHCCGDGLLL